MLKCHFFSLSFLYDAYKYFIISCILPFLYLSVLLSITTTFLIFPCYFSYQTFIEGLGIGADTTICNCYMGHVFNRLREAFKTGDLKTARIEQVGPTICVLMQ